MRIASVQICECVVLVALVHGRQRRVEMVVLSLFAPSRWARIMKISLTATCNYKLILMQSNASTLQTHAHRQMQTHALAMHICMCL